MKYFCQLLCLASLLPPACTASDSSPEPEYSAHQGVEVYLSKRPNPFQPGLDYSKVNLDTIDLLNEPLIRYIDIATYQQQDHQFTLQAPLEALPENLLSVRGRMFVVTVDGHPVYCGFLMPLYSSLIPEWVYIHAPIETAKETNIPIGFLHQQTEKDPRSNARLIDRLRKDGKLR